MTQLPSGILVRDKSNNKIYFYDNDIKRIKNGEIVLENGKKKNEIKQIKDKLNKKLTIEELQGEVIKLLELIK